LRRFVKAGGVMLCAGRVPMELDDAGRAHAARWGAAESVIELRLGGDEIVAEVARILEARLRPPVKISGDGASDVMATRRKTRAGEILFLTNFGARTADIGVEIDGAWRQIDAVKAEMGAPLAERKRLLPNESLLFMRSGARRARVSAAAPGHPLELLGDEWMLRLPDGNVVTLPLAIFTGKSAARPPDARATAWTEPCIETAPMELTPERTYWLRREIEIAYRPRRLEMVVDGCDGCEVFVNRRRIPAVKARPPVWDDDNLCCDIRKAVRRGRNEILIRYTPARIRRFVSRLTALNALPPFVLRGDFLAASRLDRPDVVPLFTALPGRVETGALRVRGYPNFTGTVEYYQTVRLKKAAGRVLLDMGRQNDLFEVEINGRPAGVLAWAPYCLEVGALLKRGNNRFVFRLRTALADVCSKRSATKEPSAGMLETPVLYNVLRSSKYQQTER